MKLRIHLGDDTFQGWDSIFLNSISTLKQQALYGSVSLVGRPCSFRNQYVQLGVAPLTIIPSDPLGGICVSFFIILGSASVEVLALRGERLLPRNTARVLLSFKIQLPLLFQVFVTRKQQAGKGVFITVPVFTVSRRLVYRHTVGLREEYAWKTSHPLVFPCQSLVGNGQAQRPWPKQSMVTRVQPT